ncbi:cytochrome P450 [Lactarius deliciosus]|nr:cytochrome P450 [Lactarius deliciosus]
MLLVHDDDLARLDEVYDRTPLDTVLSHIRGLKPTVHSVRIDPKDISSARNSASADTESAWVATLSNIFEKQCGFHGFFSGCISATLKLLLISALLSTSSASQSLHVKTPFPDPSPVAIAREYHDVRQVLGSAQFRHLYGDKGARIVSGEGFFLASNNDVESQRDRAEVLRVLRSSPEQADQIAQYFYEKTRELINIKSYSLNDKNVKYVDIVCDVLRYMPLHWAATELAGLTLKADSESLGDYTEPELYEMITDIYSLLFLDVDPSKAMNIEARAKENIKGLQRHIKANILADVGGKLSISNLVGTIQSLFNAKAKKQRLSVAESLFESGASADRSTNNVLSLLVGASVELSQSLINIVNFYIDKPNIVEQLRAADAKNPALEAYIYEAMRIDPPFRGVYRESLADQTVGSIAYFKGQRVFLDLTHASHDPNVFPEPHTVNVKRESKDRYLTGDGVTRSLGVDLTAKIMGQVLRAVFEVNGMRRTPGLSGHLKRHKVAAENTLRHEYLGADYLPTAWPNTMVLQYDVAAPQVNGS